MTITIDRKKVEQIAEEAAILKRDVETAYAADFTSRLVGKAKLAESEFLRALKIVGFPGVKYVGNGVHDYVFELADALAAIDGKGEE